MLRFLFRVWLALVLFFIGLLFGRRPSSDSDDPRQRVGSRRGRRSVSRHGIDRSDVVDVPFTEIAPPEETRGANSSASVRPETNAARPEPASTRPEPASARPDPAAARPEGAAGLP